MNLSSIEFAKVAQSVGCKSAKNRFCRKPENRFRSTSRFFAVALSPFYGCHLYECIDFDILR